MHADQQLSVCHRIAGAQQALAIHHGKDLIAAPVPTPPSFALMQSYTTGYENLRHKLLGSCKQTPARSRTSTLQSLKSSNINTLLLPAPPETRF